MCHAGKCSWPVLLGIEQPPFLEQASGIGQSCCQYVGCARAYGLGEDRQGLNGSRVQLIQTGMIARWIIPLKAVQNITKIGRRSAATAIGLIDQSVEQGVIKTNGYSGHAQILILRRRVVKPESYSRFAA